MELLAALFGLLAILLLAFMADSVRQLRESRAYPVAHSGRFGAPVAQSELGSAA